MHDKQFFIKLVFCTKILNSHLPPPGLPPRQPFICLFPYSKVSNFSKYLFKVLNCCSYSCEVCYTSNTSGMCDSALKECTG